MARFFDRPFSFDRTARIFISGIIIFLVGSVIYGLRAVLIPFALAFIFAYVLMPFVSLFQHKLRFKSRALSVIIVLVLIAGIIVLLVVTLIPAIKMEIAKAWATFGSNLTISNLVGILPDWLQEYIYRNVNPENLMQKLSLDRMVEGGKEVFSQLGKLVSGTISVVTQVVLFSIGLLYFIFILSDMETIVQGTIKLFPQRHRYYVRQVVADLDFYMNRYFRGQALIALIVGCLFAIGFTIIGLPLGLTVGLFVGLLNFVPYMQILGVPALILLAALKSIQTGDNFFFILILVVGIMVVVQVIQDTILTPRIMGHHMGMRPSLILLALSVWGSLLGLLGMIIALPLSMSLYSIYKRLILKDPSYVRKFTQNRDANRAKRQERISLHKAKLAAKAKGASQ